MLAAWGRVSPSFFSELKKEPVAMLVVLRVASRNRRNDGMMGPGTSLIGQ